MRVSLHDFPHATKSAASRFFCLTNLLHFPFTMPSSSIFNSVLLRLLIFYTHTSPTVLYVMCFAFYFLQKNKKIIIFSSISCFHYYLYRRLMFLLSFFCLSSSHVESNVCLPTVDVPLLVCVYMFVAVGVCDFIVCDQSSNSI